MNRSALPLVCGRYGLVNLCCTPKALQAAANSLDRKGTPLSVSRRDAHAQPRVVRHRVVDGFVLLLLAMHGDEVDARVVDGHKQRLPAWTLDRVAPVASHSTTGSDDAPELLGVDAAFLIAMMQMVCTQDLAAGSPEEFCYLQELQNPADLHLAGIQNQVLVEMKAEAAQHTGQALAKQALPVSAYRFGSNKSQWFMDASKLATYLDQKKVQAEQQWRAVRC